jgi:maleamate amidohydrolase
VTSDGPQGVGLDRDYEQAGFLGRLQPGERPALLVVDMMHVYFDDGAVLRLPDQECLAAAAQLLAAARASGRPVVHTRVEFGPNAADGGLFPAKVPALRSLVGPSRLNRPMPQVAPRDDEITITKQYASAFFGTGLAALFTSWQVDTVVVAGVSTSGCVRASAVDALQSGFVPVVVREAVGDRDPRPHDANLFDLQAKYAEVVDLATGLELLAGGPDATT